ncbi:MAG: Nramp family divalent metal transporter [Verrucomicrobiota bacterium]
MPSPVIDRPTVDFKPVPTRWQDIARQIGPGLIISAVIVGSGELIVTPTLGASVGFQLLWFIIIGCFIKVFVQIELGRFAITKGMTTLEAMNSIPGPKLIVSWLVWLWALMYLGLLFQLAGMVSGIASVFALAGLNLPVKLIGLAVGTVTAALLFVGRYRMVELFSTVLVVLFTICTLVAVGALQMTSFAVTPAQLWEGMKFQLPKDFTIAFATFGIIGVGASELIYYPYWCLEKGYGKNVGPFEPGPRWLERARGWIRIMHLDAFICFLIYTTATLAFYLLGAAVLHAKGLKVENAKMIETLSHMYRETFGPWSFWLFLVGAFSVLYSTVFCATASNARLLADALALFKAVKYPTPEDRARMVRIGCVIVPIAYVTVFMVWGEPVSLVLVGAIAQGLMLPFLAFAALYFRYCRIEPALRPGAVWTFWLWIAAVAMAAVGGYQVMTKLQLDRLFKWIF